MKYCLTSRQSMKYLKLADEIIVKSRDFRQISDLFVEYPDKMIILDLSNNDLDNEDIRKTIKQYSESSENFCCCIYNLYPVNWFINNNIKFYYGYPISSYYDMRGLIELGVEYVKITAPLTFDMDTLAKCDVKFRMVPNVAFDAYVPREDGICGQWVRPEDVEYYEAAIDVFEFENANLEQERTLYDIYATNKVWNGNLNILITNLNVDIDNRALPDEIGEMRANCRQRCMERGTCHFCKTAVKFGAALRKYKRDRDLENKQNTPQD